MELRSAFQEPDHPYRMFVSRLSCRSCSVSLVPCREALAQTCSRKEVIQPQLPLQLPCYDFVPVTSPAFGECLLPVNPSTSGVTSSHDVTGGVYKARERIHRSIADLRLLATPASCRRVAACNPNYERLFRIRSASRLRSPLYRPL